MATARTAEVALASRAGAFVALTKPDVSFLVVVTTAAGYYMATGGPVNWLRLVHAAFATALIAAGTAALNHYLERDSDRYMRRTASRPLPSGALEPVEALAFGAGLAMAGAVDLYVVGGWLTAGLGILTSLAYLLAYTPLKKRTVWATFVGAFPGAIPPMIGWAAARGTLDGGAWLLFAILFLWQFPHFHAIAWIYREDYARASLRMLPVVDPDGRRTSRSMIAWCVALLLVSLLPLWFGPARWAYAAGAVLLGLAFLGGALRFRHERTVARARTVLRLSLLYLPGLLALLLLDGACTWLWR